MGKKLLLTPVERSVFLKENFGDKFDFQLESVLVWEMMDLSRFDLVLPQTVIQQKFLIDRGLIGRNILVNENRIIELFDNKLNTFKFLEDIGLGSNIPCYSNPPLPYLMKPIESTFASEGITFCDTELPDKEGFYKQEYRMGDLESTITVFVRNGVVLSTKKFNYDANQYEKRYGVNFKKPSLDSYPEEYASGMIKEGEVKSPEKEFIEKVCDELGFTGVVNFQFTEIDRELIFFEINPRPNGLISLYFEEFIEKALEVIK